MPMILRINEYQKQLEKYVITIPEIEQNMKEEDLINMIEKYDAWIAGDDPVTKKVLEKAVNLKVLVKWGIGTDNIDLEYLKKTEIPFFNTPGMFGNEVADIAIGYLLALVRKLYFISNEVKLGNWVKPSGMSLQDKKIGLIGFGDIGRNIADRLISLKTKIYVYDPGFTQFDGKIECVYNKNLIIDERLNKVKISNIKNVFEKTKIVIISCSANPDNFHLINEKTIEMLEDKCYIINVSRGSLVDEESVFKNLENGKIEGFASDVFEKEPISQTSPLLKSNKVIAGSHNASNTTEAVDRTSIKAIDILNNFF